MLVNGAPLDYGETYRVVTNDFLAGGQDGWVTFADGTNRWNTYYDMQEAVNEYIVLNSPITPTVEGRIVYSAPAGPEGPAGPAGPAGPTGSAGPQGEPAPTEVVWGSMGIAIVALLAALYAVTKRK